MVEFVHPVVMGKRALPAMDLGPEFEARVAVLLQPQDRVMGFAFPDPNPAVEQALRRARRRGALTIALAEANREKIDQAGTFVITLMSSLGAGKTTILERTLEQIGSRLRLGVLGGDIRTTLDAVNPGVERILMSARTGQGSEEWCAWLMRSSAAGA